MDRDYWIARPKWHDQFQNDMIIQCYFQWWQCQQWDEWLIAWH